MTTFLHKLFTAFLSILIFSALLATFQGFVMNNELSIALLLPIYIFYTAPAFILGGITASYIVDIFLKKSTKKFGTKLQEYVHSLILYVIAGIIVAMVYSSITSISKGEYFSTFSQSLMSIVIGISATIVFYGIHTVLDINWGKMIKEQEQRELEKVKQLY